MIVFQYVVGLKKSLPSGNLLQFAIENDHLFRWVSREKWWFSIVMLVYQRVLIISMCVYIDCVYENINSSICCSSLHKDDKLVLFHVPISAFCWWLKPHFFVPKEALRSYHRVCPVVSNPYGVQIRINSHVFMVRNSKYARWNYHCWFNPHGSCLNPQISLFTRVFV